MQFLDKQNVYQANIKVALEAVKDQDKLSPNIIQALKRRHNSIRVSNTISPIKLARCATVEGEESKDGSEQGGAFSIKLFKN
jgi:hypothetical protein